MNNFFTAMSQCRMFYGTEINDEDDFAEIGLTAWNMIGNKRTKLYHVCRDIDCSTLSIELPCNADIIEAVTYSYEDFNHSPSYAPDYRFVEQYSERRKHFDNPLYQSGKFVKYERVGNTLYFDKDYGRIHILYRGVILDDDGLPELTDKETDAIATFVAYMAKYKEGLKNNNSNIIQMSQLLKRDWERKCDQARTPDYINQNDMNEILDAKSSWDRKHYNYSYKPLR